MNYFIPTFSDEIVAKNNVGIARGRKRTFNNNYSVELHNLLTTPGSKLTGLSIKRNIIGEVCICEAVMNKVSFAGTSFSSTKFKNCSLKMIHAQNCKFSEVIFEGESNNICYNSDFSGSFFGKCIFKNISFKSGSFLDCVFWNCKFENCTFRSVTFENAIFSACDFNNVNMVFLNIEYSTMKNCNIVDSKFSWYQVPYINCFFSNNFEGNNIIKAISKEYPIASYLINLEKSIIYFTSQKQYFPLVSLYLENGNKEFALAALNNGIEEAIAKKDLRLVGLYGRCGIMNKLLSTAAVSTIIKKLDTLFLSNNGSENEIETYNKLLYIKTKQQLMFPDIIPSLEIVVQTNVGEDQLYKVGKLCGEIDEIVEANRCKAVYKISHNSDPNLIITIIGVTIRALQFVWSLISHKLESKKQDNTINNINVSNNININNHENSENDDKCIKEYYSAVNNSLLNDKEENNED